MLAVEVARESPASGAPVAIQLFMVDPNEPIKFTLKSSRTRHGWVEDTCITDGRQVNDSLHLNKNGGILDPFYHHKNYNMLAIDASYAFIIRNSGKSGHGHHSSDKAPALIVAVYVRIGKCDVNELFRKISDLLNS